jgi:bifunctional non-homologous end joining protein LigD
LFELQQAGLELRRGGGVPPGADGAGVDQAAEFVVHPEQQAADLLRVIDASTGAPKLDLVRYYESVADWMVPHLKGRPCSLVRGPNGIAGELFFQKHGNKLRIPDVRELDPALWPGHEALLEVPTARAIAGAAQMNVIEFHTWNAVARNIDKPDRVIFDLDPGQGVAWERVQEAASLTRVMLEELGIKAWLKTSGGKGLPRGGAAGAAPRLGDRQRFFPDGGAAHVLGHSGPVRGQERA